MPKFPQTYWSRHGARILEPHLAVGGEGSIHPVKGTDLVAKLYLPGLAKSRKARIEAMCQDAPHDPSAGVHLGHATYAWPLEPLWKDSARTEFAGFLMKRIDKSRCRTLLNLADPKLRCTEFPKASWNLCLRAAENLARAVHGVHEKGHRVGDLRELNLMVSQEGLVTLIDCDSFQIGSKHPCLVGTPDYLPPEMMSMDFSKAPPDRLHSDRWALAVLTWQLLMDGYHPFQAVSDSLPQGISREERISQGLTPLCDGDLNFPSKAPSLDVLAAPLLALFRQCFGPGHTEPSVRPTAEDFVQVLEKINTKVCKTNPAHGWSGKARSCPWCRQNSSSWPDLSPLLEVSVEQQRPYLSVLSQDTTKIRMRAKSATSTTTKAVVAKPTAPAGPKSKTPPPSAVLPPPASIRVSVRTPLLRKRFTTALVLTIGAFWWVGRPSPISPPRPATVQPVPTKATLPPAATSAAVPSPQASVQATQPGSTLSPSASLKPTATASASSTPPPMAAKPPAPAVEVIVPKAVPAGASLFQRASVWTALLWKGGVAWVTGTGRSVAAWWNRPSPTKGKVQANGGMAMVTSPGLNLRQSPNPKATLLRALHEEEKVAVLDRTGRWWKVEDSAGLTGWALGKHMELQ